MDAKCLENSRVTVSDSLVTVGVPRAADDSGQTTEQSDTVQYLTTPEKTLQMMPK